MHALDQPFGAKREAAVERCEVDVDDGPGQMRCRLNIKMICKHGVTKAYHLTYEPTETMRALFDKNRATNHWKINAKHLREYIEFFAPKTEQLDIYAEEGKCTFLAYTEKITHGKEILKQPLQTAVSIATDDFQEFEATEDLHVVISVKDFKNMVVHAETLRTVVTALYSQPSKPLQFSYRANGMHCEFTLMTIGESQAVDTASVPKAATRSIPPRQASKSATTTSTRPNSEMPPPPRATVSKDNTQQPRLGRHVRPTSAQPSDDQDSQTLFVSADDDDRQWQPVDQQEEEQDVLGWDASGEHDVPLRASYRGNDDLRRNQGDDTGFDDSGIAPTQRASQVRGMIFLRDQHD